MRLAGRALLRQHVPRQRQMSVRLLNPKMQHRPIETRATRALRQTLS